MHVRIGLALAALYSLTSCGAIGQTDVNRSPDHSPISTAVRTSDAQNSEAQLLKPTVVIVLLDGFRFDYARKFHARTLLQMAEDGASAPQGMTPSYPSISIPNYYTIASGLYPDHHGLIDNQFFDRAKKRMWDATKLSDRNDASWYAGNPLWVVAEKAGMRTACIAWVGCEANIQGVLPTYIVPYKANDHTITNTQKVDQVITWLRLPESQRPHLLMMWVADTDHVGHAHGPDSPEMALAVKDVDALVSRMRKALAESKSPTYLLVLSDHGMATVQGDWIDLDQYFGREHILPEDLKIDGTRIFARTSETADQLYSSLLKQGDRRFNTYRAAQVPSNLHYGGNPRAGDPVVIAKGAYLIRAGDYLGDHDNHPTLLGNHGYDPEQVPEMMASFFLVGPDVIRGLRLAPFPNVDVYSTVLDLLDLSAPLNDGHIVRVRKSEAGTNK